MLAAYRGHFKIVRYLLRKRADPRLRSLVVMNALHYAAAGGNAKIVELILNNGMDSNTPTQLETNIKVENAMLSPRTAPVDMEGVAQLVDIDMGVRNAPRPGTTALDIAIINSDNEPDAHLDTIEVLINHRGRRGIVPPERSLKNFSEETKIDILLWACKRGNLAAIANIVHILGTADIRFKNAGKYTNATRLIAAYITNKLESTTRIQVVRLLLLLGADPRVPIVNGKQLIHMAAQLGCIDAVLLFLKAGVEVDVRIQALNAPIGVVTYLSGMPP